MAEVGDQRSAARVGLSVISYWLFGRSVGMNCLHDFFDFYDFYDFNGYGFDDLTG